MHVKAVLAAQHAVRADVVSQIVGAITSFFSSVLNGIENFFGTIFQSFANLIASIFTAPVVAIQNSFVTLSNSAQAFGVLAPLVTIAIVAVIIILAVFVLWLVIKLSTSEAEETGTEIEEGT